MSLFGTSPDESVGHRASHSRSSLFDDEPPAAAGSKSSLFADDDDASPWGLPTPKKAARGELIKNLLPASDVPDVYVDYFDEILKHEDLPGGRIGSSGMSRVLSAGKLSADDQTKIMNVIAPGGQAVNLGRNEFNVLLALVGLAQEGEDITLDGVDERRKNLPIPKLPTLASTLPQLPGADQLSAKPAQRPITPATPSQTQTINPIKPRNVTRGLDDPEADPWASPAAAKRGSIDTPRVNGGSSQGSNGFHEPVRTTSTFTTNSVEDSLNGSSILPTQSTGGSLWGSLTGTSNTSFSNPGSSGIGGEGFGDASGGDGGDQPPLNIPPPRPIGGGRATGAEEIVTVILLPEKEGVFMLKHHNYEVASVRRNSKVVRRYSDFVWLLDCLQKRYPFRQLPLLPPKRVAVNGNHLAADASFMEKRRRGLVRFVNALVRHPVLNQEQLVIMFLTVPTELAVWRKQANLSVQEEFTGKSLPPGLEDSLSPSLNDLFETSRSGIRRSAEIYINLCNLLDRLTKRNEGLAADHLRISLALQSLTDASQDTYSTDTNDVPLLNEGLNATAKHLSTSQALLEDEARAWDQGVLEDLKRQRDALVSMRDMFDRRDRYDKDNIPTLERRIQANETKLAGLRAKPEGLVKPGEIEKVTEAIIKDKESIVAQHARGVFVKECIRDELIFFQQSQYHVSRWNQDWAQERVKYAELQADNWKRLNEELESMPLGES